MLERAHQRRLISIKQDNKDLWVPDHGSMDPLKEYTPILSLYEKKL
jgi:hypothetical protein